MIDQQRLFRTEMVETQLRRRGIADANVLRAMEKVPRHIFVPDELLSASYADHPLPIADGQTISQPYIVAIMSELLGIDSSSKVLEVGAGCGYQTAVLAEIAGMVFSLEFLCSLAEDAIGRIRGMGYGNVIMKCGNGWQGWDRAAPFDAILVAAAPDNVPPKLVEQLAPGGRMVIPVGRDYQELVLITKSLSGEVMEKNLFPVRFVPMVGGDGMTKDNTPPDSDSLKACG